MLFVLTGRVEKVSRFLTFVQKVPASEVNIAGLCQSISSHTKPPSLCWYPGRLPRKPCQAC